MDNYLNQISTQWTEINNIIEKDGEKAFVNYLYEKYAKALQKAIVKKLQYSPANKSISEDIVSDVFFEFIKNEYSLSKKLDNKKKLRGLFYIILRRKLYQKLSEEQNNVPWDDSLEGNVDGIAWEKHLDGHVDEVVGLKIDVENIKQKLKEEKEHLYQVFHLRFNEGKKLNEIADELELTLNIVRYRIEKIQQWFNQTL